MIWVIVFLLYLLTVAGVWIWVLTAQRNENYVEGCKAQAANRSLAEEQEDLYGELHRLALIDARNADVQIEE